MGYTKSTYGVIMNKENEKTLLDTYSGKKHVNHGEPDAGFQDKVDFENIFKEMLHLEKPKNLQSKIKYCLVKVSIEELEKAVSETGINDKNYLLYQFSNFLVKNLRKRDIYLMAEPGNFLILFSDSSIESVENTIKRIQMLVEKEYGGKIRIKSSVEIGTEKEQEITPIISKSHLFSTTNRVSKRSPEKVVSKSNVGKSVFLNFVFSFFIFSSVLLILEAFIYYGLNRFVSIPANLQPDTLFLKYLPGFSNILQNMSIAITPFVFFTIQTFFVCLVFGAGMFAGYMINLKMGRKGKINTRQ